MRDVYKNLLIMVVSGLLAAGGVVSVAEALLSQQYDTWKTQFEKGKELSPRLSVASKDPILLWEYRPNTLSRYRGMLIQTNRYGFRDRDYAVVSRPKGVYRIAFIGDSVTVGLFVEDQETFVKKFEHYAQALNPSLQALNFGVDGYNPDQIYELLRSRVLSFEPNKVVYVMCLNDFDLFDASGQKMLYFKKPRSFVVEKLKALFAPAFKLRANDSEFVRGNVEYHLWHFRKNKAYVFEKIMEMQRLLKKESMEFEVVVVPIFHFSNNNKFSKYPLIMMHRDIDDFLKRNGIEFLDLIEAFGKQPRSGSYFSADVWHPNANGHEFIAEQLFQAYSSSAGIKTSAAGVSP